VINVSAPNDALKRHGTTRILLPAGAVYFFFAILTAIVGVLGIVDIRSLRSYLPQGFTYLPAARNNVLPEDFLTTFFFFLFVLAVYRLIVGLLTLINRKNPHMGGFLGLLGKIDLWLIILTTVFTAFMISGFGFIWFPLISFAPTMMLLHGSARIDDRPGGALRAESRAAKIFLIPAFLGLTFITYIPLAAVFGISLYNWNFPFPLEFAGLANYTRILTDPLFANSVRVTLIYAFLTVSMGMIYSMVIALLLNRKMPGRAFFRTVFYLPFIIPAVSSFMVFRLMYNPHFGFFNNLITMFGGERVNFLFDTSTIIPSLAVIAVWTSGNIIVIKMAGLNNVPRTYLEAAEIDGANAWWRFWKITIPVMSPIIFYNMLMSLITHMQVVIPSLMMAGGGGGGTGVIDPSYRFVTFELYTRGIRETNFGLGSAISFVLFVMVGIFTAILFATSKSWLFYDGGGAK
jgi:multiple sugar transport system permease protein